MSIRGATVLLAFRFSVYYDAFTHYGVSLSYLGRRHGAKKINYPLGVSEPGQNRPHHLLFAASPLTTGTKPKNWLGVLKRTGKSQSLSLSYFTFFLLLATTTILRLYAAVILLDTGPSLLLHSCSWALLAFICALGLDWGWHGSVGFFLLLFLADAFGLLALALALGSNVGVYFLRRGMGGGWRGGWMVDGSFGGGCLSLVCVDTNVYMKIMQSRNGGVANSDD